MVLTQIEINNEIKRRLNALYTDFIEFEDFINVLTKDSWHTFANATWDEEGFDTGSGYSRGVIIFDNFDYVVKINFLGVEDDFDFCEYESKIYNEAVANKMQEFFAETWYGGTFLDVPFYVMRKAETNECIIGEDYYSDVYESDNRYYNKACSLEMEEDECAIINFFGNYLSVERVLELVEFCGYIGMTDVHEGNLGYIDNSPVFIDYAGVY